jgi:hypothetical protein
MLFDNEEVFRHVTRFFEEPTLTAQLLPLVSAATRFPQQCHLSGALLLARALQYERT